MKQFIKWFAICVAIFVISVFLHECGHGLANAMSGIPCSTGFNRVGDVYKRPTDEDFRAYYATAQPVLLDFGVPCTLLLAVLGTVVFAKSKGLKSRCLSASIAIDNCLLRLIPCSLVLLTPLITGKTHVEDEYETGQLLAQLTGKGFLLYIPAAVSWIITFLCLVIVSRTARKHKIQHGKTLALTAILAACAGFALAFFLDNFVRINWKPI